MIKNIEDLKNIQIVCRNQEQVKNCLSFLKKLGFKVEFLQEEDYLVIYFDTDCGCVNFSSRNFVCEGLIEFYNKELIKTLQNFIKQKQEVKDFEVAEDGRIIKINNWMSEKQIFLLFSRDKVDGVINRFLQGCLMKYVDLGLVYATQKSRDKAMFKIEIETKLRNIAERLNKGRKIDWEDKDQSKYEICYDYKHKELNYGINCNRKFQGIIYCLNENFLEVAKKEIGEENLIKYFKES